MLMIYPAIFHEEEGSYWVEFPDLSGCHSHGDTLEEVVSAAKEALEGYCLTVLESGGKLPAPTPISELEASQNAFASLVDCKLTNTKQRAVKKTLTIPYWLNERAVAENVNFSAVLQEGLKNALNLTE